MKKQFLFALLSMIISVSVFAQGTWTNKANFGGVARHAAAGFVIGTKAYIGTGTDDTNFFKDFWEWDQTTNAWTQKATYLGAARREAVGFSIGTKGYIGTGCCPYYSDFWEYDPAGNSWTQKANFPGGATTTCIAFSIGGKGYMGLGDDGGASFSKKLYEYDPVGDTWAQKANFPGAGRTDAIGFALNDKGYVGIGDDGSPPMLQDFWEYDPVGNNWTQKANFPGGPRTTATGFAIQGIGKGYIGTGDNDAGTLYKDFYEWDQATNTWRQVADFGGGVRTDETPFSIGNKGYVAVGSLGGFPNYKDFWEYTPDSSSGVGEDLMNEKISMTIYPNPFSDEAVIQYALLVSEKVSINLYTVSGQKIKNIFSGHSSAGAHALELEADELNLTQGVYFLELQAGRQRQFQKIVIAR